MELSRHNSNVLYLLRILAAQTVLLGHLFSDGFVSITYFRNERYFPYIQSLAVLVFFLLSGFLTDYSLKRKESNPSYTFKKFFTGHFRRIFIYLIPALILIAVLDGILLKTNPAFYRHLTSYDAAILLKNLFLVPFDYTPFGSGRPLWTLHIEWWLYLSYGYFYLVCRKRFREKQLRVHHIAILVLLLLYPLRFHLQLQSGRMAVLCFFLGIMIHRCYGNLQYRRWTIPTAVVAFLLCAIYTKDAYHLQTVLMMSALFLLILLPGREKESQLSERQCRLLAFASGCTYPLYLLHYSLIELFLAQQWQLAPLTMLGLCFVASNLLALLFYLMILGVQKIKPCTFLLKKRKVPKENHTKVT